jgi:hypothetical protein
MNSLRTVFFALMLATTIAQAQYAWDGNTIRLFHLDNSFIDANPTHPDTATSSAAFAPGKWGNAIFLQNTNVYMQINDDSKFSKLTFGNSGAVGPNFTIECYFKIIHSNSGGNIFISYGYGSSFTISVLTGPNQPEGATVYVTSSTQSQRSYTLTNTKAIDTINWHYIAWERGGQTDYLVLDGNSVSHFNSFGTDSFACQRVYVGYDGGGGALGTYVDEIRFSNIYRPITGVVPRNQPLVRTSPIFSTRNAIIYSLLGRRILSGDAVAKSPSLYIYQTDDRTIKKTILR